MQKLPEVENAKALMNEAISWSVVKWLREKKKVRKAADLANAALDGLSKSIKDSWDGNVKREYEFLTSHQPKGTHPKTDSDASTEAARFAKKVKEADDDAHRARMDAENTFDEAERLLSTALAREGCKKAIRSWELHEKAIRLAQR